MSEIYDVTIVGAGPAGLFSSFYSGLREMKTKIIDNQNTLGGKIHAYPEKMIWDVGGLTPVLGEKLMEQLAEQATTFEPTVILRRKVINIEKLTDGLFLLQTNDGENHFSKTLILAVGSGILAPKKIGLKDEEKYIHTNLHYMVDSLKNFKNKTVLISGGGHSAVDWANTLEPIAKKVIVTYRKGEFIGHEAEISKLKNSSADIIYYTNIVGFEGVTCIEKVVLEHVETGKKQFIHVDEVIINHGYDKDNTLFEQSKVHLKLHEKYGLRGNPFGVTSEPGIFAAGDSLNYEGKLHLIAGAFQDAVHAVNQAKQFIEPEADQMAMVSSHNDLLKDKNKELYNHLVIG
ncbi:NAD(P)/FAD-dependent oxidoreductase [Pseudogracilibacillus sp. SO30301A]|uniref:NAD(P)/FAD-dependent oxidoreductase n=1 Tax=Pseudogracilibacillus sp. SO30301A TaxID=3098291 RepID=UPI00300DE6F0